MRARTIPFTWAMLLVLALPVPGRAAVNHDLGQAPLSQVRLAFTQTNNVYLMNALGGSRITVTTRGTDRSAQHLVRYPAYSWSPDGRYLLLVRSEQSRESLLLLDQYGAVLRTLASNVLSDHFLPSWAQDGDQIVYEAWEKPLKNARYLRAYHAVNRVDLSGHKTFLWGFYADDYCEGFGAPPADDLYQQEMGDYYYTRPSMQWSISRHLAVYSTTCVAVLLTTDTRTGRNRQLGAGNAPWYEAAISPSGTLAASSGPLESGPGGPVVLANARTGAVFKSLGPGELPAWSPDGRFVYFVRRTKGPALNLQPTMPTEWAGGPMETYTTAIWRANADGSHLLRVTSQDAFGFGHLQMTPDGRFLIYSRVDNPWNLWQHRLAGNRYTNTLLQLYGPRVSIQRLAVGGQPVTIASGAGSPVVRPYEASGVRSPST